MYVVTYKQNSLWGLLWSFSSAFSEVHPAGEGRLKTKPHPLQNFVIFFLSRLDGTGENGGSEKLEGDPVSLVRYGQKLLQEGHE